MKFGMFIVGENVAEGVTDAERLAQIMEQVELAESLGFDAVWFAEHHFSSYGIVGNPITLAMAAAQRTTNIRVGAGIVVMPFAHPVKVAEEAALVDNLSGGRFDLGIGRGYQPSEFRGMGVDMTETQDRLAEGLDIVERALSGEKFDHKGTYWNLQDVEIRPKPVQQPFPIWVAAGSPDSFTTHGSLGRQILTAPNYTPKPKVKQMNQLYRDAFATSGVNGGTPHELPMLQQVYVGENSEAAVDLPKDYALQFFRKLGHLIADDGREVDSYEVSSKIARRMNELSYEELLREGVVFGTGAEVVDKLAGYRDELGVSYWMSWFDFGGLPHEEVMASIERFGKSVIPQLR